MKNLLLLLRRFRREDRAVAAVEFALITPFLLTMYLGSIEGAALYTADKRVNSVSATIGDLVSQWDMDDGKLPTSSMDDYMAASTLIMMPYSTTGLKVVVSLVKVKADGTTVVLWSKANTGATARTVNTAFPNFAATTMMNQVAQKGCIIAAEASYSYKPMLAQVFTTALNLGHTNFFMPRFGSTMALNLQTTSLANTACTAA
jgi:Flp pilus assembly protein TadG